MVSKLEPIPDGEYVPTADQRVVMYGVAWDDFEKLLEARGDRSPPLLAYLDGAVEIMSPGPRHEEIKSDIGRLVEQFMLHHGVKFKTVGSWLIKRRKEKAGVEPDECYVLTGWPKDRPDLAIEVVWTSGGIDKLEIYRRLGVPEVWFWIKGAITVHVLTATGYERRARSACLPQVELDVVCEMLEISETSEAIMALQARLRGSPGGSSAT